MEASSFFPAIPSASLGKVSCTQPYPGHGAWLSDPRSTLALPCKNTAQAASSCVRASAQEMLTQEGGLREFPRLLLQEELLLSDAYL